MPIIIIITRSYCSGVYRAQLGGSPAGTLMQSQSDGGWAWSHCKRFPLCLVVDVTNSWASPGLSPGVSTLGLCVRPGLPHSKAPGFQEQKLRERRLGAGRERGRENGREPDRSWLAACDQLWKKGNGTSATSSFPVSSHIQGQGN